jgi:hypothetical protein
MSDEQKRLLEPEAKSIYLDEITMMASAAISMKRIADDLAKLVAMFERIEAEDQRRIR